MQRDDQLHYPPHESHPHKLRIKPAYTRRTHPFTWLAAACCAVVWALVILGGLAVLIVYLVFRPRSPRLGISSATLNGAYLDEGDRLNADLTLLLNLSNPNRKVDVAFAYLELDLYFKGTLVATQALDPFLERRGETALRSVHMVTSEVALLRRGADAWRQQVAGGEVTMEVRGSFRTRSALGRFLRYWYWLYGHCSIVVGGPPSGALLSSQCRTRR